MILLRIRVEAAGVAERRELVQALLSLARSIRQTPGSTDARLYEDVETTSVFGLSSGWRTAQDLENYISEAEFGVLLGALDVLGRRPELELTESFEGAEDAATLIRRLRGRALDRDHAPDPSSSQNVRRGD